MRSRCQTATSESLSIPFVIRPILLAAFAASTIAADVSVIWRHEKSSGSTSLTVHAAENDAILAESCGSSIGTLDFSSIDENGFGNVTIGDSTFRVSAQSQSAGGVSCTREYNGVIAVAECAGLSFDVPEDAVRSADCFSNDDAKASFAALDPRNIILNYMPTTVEQRSTQPETFKIGGRQICHVDYGTVRVGDGMPLQILSSATRMGELTQETGNPHQNYLHKRLSVIIRFLARLP